MIQLSPKQARIYEFILSFTQENGYPPSVREIAVHFHLKSLEEAGVITRGAGKTRAITAVHQVERPPVAPEARVPVLGNVAAGEPILAEELVEEYIPFDASGEDCFALRIRGRRRVRKIIEAFCRRRDKTMIMVTHYENELPETITHRLCLTRNR